MDTDLLETSTYDGTVSSYTSGLAELGAGAVNKNSQPMVAGDSLNEEGVIMADFEDEDG